MLSIGKIGFQEILFIIFIAGFLLQLFYYLFFFRKLAFYKPKNKIPSLPPVSVVISARNEAYWLEINLPPILEQDYPEYEVVVVNDCSNDHSNFLLEALAKKYSHLKIVSLTETVNFFYGKKFPLSIGIKSAAYEYLLLTDADCRPSSERWIREMLSNYDDSTDIVLGYGPYEKGKGLLNRLIRFDAFYIALQYLSFALSGLAYMGVGRNLSYRKKLFMEHKGFTSHYSVPSGDDDLFINQVADHRNVRIETSPGSYTYSKPSQTWNIWYLQKRRHFLTGKYYRTKFKWMLGVLQASQYLFFAGLLMLLLLNYHMPELVLVFLLRFIVQMIVIKKISDRLNEKDLLLFSPIFEIFFLIFNPLVFISGIFTKSLKWK